MMPKITYIDNSAANDKFISLTLSTEKLIPSWRDSILSRDWLEPSGALKTIKALKADHQKQTQNIIECLKSGKPIAKPVLGIGIMDNVEIGSGRATFFTLAQQGITEIEVHIPRSNQDEFTCFI